MKKNTKHFVMGVFVFLLAGCATLQDVQRSTDLIRSDNELARILVDVRPNNHITAASDMIILANHAKGAGDALKDDQSKVTDAIAYYRIAATAYWRSGKAQVVNDLFEVTNNGMDLCASMGENAPDRDCLFLQLVIPFAGLESHATNKDLSGLLARVDYTDGESTSDERTLKEIRDGLTQAKPLIEKILVIGQDKRFLEHAGMTGYYCQNAKNSLSYYDSTASVFKTTINEFHEKFPNQSSSLGITVEDATELRKLYQQLPSFCH